MASKLRPSTNPGLFIVPPGTKPSDLKPNAPPDVPAELHELLFQAIETKRAVRFLYSGKPRNAEPHDYGVLTGRARLFCYQFAGESSTGTLPDWRLFDVAKISALELLDRTFAGNREVPTDKHHVWDPLFIRVTQPTK